MVIFYDKEGNIVMAEHHVMTPTYSEDIYTLDDITQQYLNDGLSFVALDLELGAKIGDYQVMLDDNGQYEGLYPREVVGE